MAEMTERLLIDAGIGPGMRVLDVGCGRGDVALLAAKMVGAQGEVVGIDRDLVALESARGRVRDAGRAATAAASGSIGLRRSESSSTGRAPSSKSCSPSASRRRRASATTSLRDPRDVVRRGRGPAHRKRVHHQRRQARGPISFVGAPWVEGSFSSLFAVLDEVDEPR